MDSMSELLPASDPDRLRWTKLSGSSGSVPISRLRGGCVLSCNHGSLDGLFAKENERKNWPRRNVWGPTRRSQKFGLAQACQTTNNDFGPLFSLHIFARVDRNLVYLSALNHLRVKMSDYGGDDDPACATLPFELGCPALAFSGTDFCQSTASVEMKMESLITIQMSWKRKPQNHRRQKSQMLTKPMKISKKLRAVGRLSMVMQARVHRSLPTTAPRRYRMKSARRLHT